MQAWRVAQSGPPLDSMRLERVPVPTAGPGQVVVRVLAASLNFPDVLMTMGEYQTKPPLPFTPGVELCGEVVDGTDDWPSGARVMGIAHVPDGALAEYAVCEAHKIFPVPSELSDTDAAAFTIAFQTAWLALHHRGRLRSGETLVVHAAAGGVGSAATLLGKAAGAHVVAVVGGDDKAQVAKALGADAVVDRHLHVDEESLAGALRSHVPQRGADLVFDPVGGTAFGASLKILAPDGRLAVIGFAGGEIPVLKVNRALLRNIDVLGVYWGGYINTSPEVVRNATSALDQLVQETGIRPLVQEVIPLEAAANGLERLRQGASVGRIVVSVSNRTRPAAGRE